MIRKNDGNGVNEASKAEVSFNPSQSSALRALSIKLAGNSNKWRDSTAVKEVSGPDSFAVGLRELIQGQIAALRMSGFYFIPELPALAKKIVSSPLLSHYRNAPNIGKIGDSYFETVGGLARNTYFAAAAATKESIDRLFSPFVNPADAMKRLLQLSWPNGAATLANENGDIFFHGLIRLFNGTEALAHVDRLEWDDNTVAAPVAQLAFNTYLRVPEEGGELVIWNVVLDRNVHDLMAKEYGVDEAYLDSYESVIIQPKAGDLIVFNAQRVHAVRKACGDRVTSSLFAVLPAFDSPIFVYS